jgi:hypothetical protein
LRASAAEAGEADLVGQVVCPPCAIGFQLAVAMAFARNGIDLARENVWRRRTPHLDVVDAYGSVWRVIVMKDARTAGGPQ